VEPRHQARGAVYLSSNKSPLTTLGAWPKVLKENMLLRSKGAATFETLERVRRARRKKTDDPPVEKVKRLRGRPRTRPKNPSPEEYSPFRSIEELEEEGSNGDSDEPYISPVRRWSNDEEDEPIEGREPGPQESEEEQTGVRVEFSPSPSDRGQRRFEAEEESTPPRQPSWSEEASDTSQYEEWQGETLHEVGRGRETRRDTECQMEASEVSQSTAEEDVPRISKPKVTSEKRKYSENRRKVISRPTNQAT